MTFDGTAGQTVTITVTWQEAYSPGTVMVFDPDGTLMAVLEEYPDSPTQRIEDLELNTTGTFEIWVSAYSTYLARPIPYSLTLECE